jgi:hypothetical protein
MITFGEWYKFNFVDNTLMDGLGDIYIKVFRKRSFKTEDKCLEGLVRIVDAVKMFGDYSLYKINYHTSYRNDFEYKALCALIFMEEEQSDDQC